MSITETAVALSIVSVTILGSLSLIGHLEALEATSIKASLRTCLNVVPDAHSEEVEVIDKIWIGKMIIGQDIKVQAELLPVSNTQLGLVTPMGLKSWKRTAKMGDYTETLETYVYLPFLESQLP